MSYWNGKGILVSKTAHGNIIVGPTASDVDNKDDVGILKQDLIQLDNLLLRV